MTKKFIAGVLASIALLPQLAFAWGADGHQTVGAIADNMLAGTKAASKVKSLLGTRTLEQISVWADCAKGISPEKDFAYTVTGRFAECQPFENPEDIQAFADFVRRNNNACNPGADEETCHKQYHYTDISLQHDHYKTGFAGTNDHDIVNAIQATIAVLRGQKAPAPFNIKDEREALMLLTHYVGDIHQPLHVGSIFLDADGKIINPDDKGLDKTTNTIGGNALQCPCGNLHSLWDDLPQNFKRGRMNDFLTKKAKTIAKDTAPPEQWAVLWADDAIRNARIVFAGAQFSERTPNVKGNNWSIALPLAYERTMAQVKEESLTKAGAHLAQLLQTIWPD
ncbi:S1/P1 nuclease [Undibacterium sp. RuTC16W]|uniref:S1/P1 nuclease n=1 Tax=Undibacterium sp. RuTC16W TaxID=3413048 RepID=UPI003BF398B4